MSAERKPEETESDIRPGQVINVSGPCEIRIREVGRGGRVKLGIKLVPAKIRRAIDKVSTID